MGEHLNHKTLGYVKLGTCEALYYCTLQEFRDNLELLSSDGSVQPEFYLEPNKFMFRFPFPDEKPDFGGHHENFERGYLLSIPKDYGVTLMHDKIHLRTLTRSSSSEPIPHSMQYGYLLTCPQNFEDADRLYNMAPYAKERDTLHFEVVFQKLVNNEQSNNVLEIQTVVRCPYCGSMCRLSYDEVKAIEAYYTELQNRLQANPMDLRVVDRIVRGYNEPT